MAYFVNLIAVRWQGNKYAVCSQTEAQIDLDFIGKLNQIHPRFGDTYALELDDNDR